MIARVPLDVLIVGNATGVAVGGSEVSVGGMSVTVAVGGTEVGSGVGGIPVGVAATDGAGEAACGEAQPIKINATTIRTNPNW